MEETAVISQAGPDQPEETSQRDVIAMIAMLDYLIVQIRPIDGMAAHCLMLARKSLGSARPPELH